jgi:hypothetical protein
MRFIFPLIAAMLLLLGCAGKSAQTGQAAQLGADAPIEFTPLGLTPDKENVAFTIKVIADKPVVQIDLGIKETDDGGKVLLDTSLLWQNKECCPRKPLEKGKSYDVKEHLVQPGTTRVECVVQRVHFEDGAVWTPKT